MMIGEGIAEDLRGKDPSLDARCDVSSVSDDCDALIAVSHYSSCGESEFERYCSADSVLGTPSLCRSGFASIDGVDSDAAATSVNDDEDDGVCGLLGFCLSDMNVDLFQQQCHKLSNSNIIDRSNGSGSDFSIENDADSDVLQPIQLFEIRNDADSEAMDVLDLPNASGSAIRTRSLTRIDDEVNNIDRSEDEVDNIDRSEDKVDPLSELKDCVDVVDNDSNNQDDGAGTEGFLSISGASSYPEKSATVEYSASKLLDRGCFDLDENYKVSIEDEMFPKGCNDSESGDSMCNHGSYEYQRSSFHYKDELQSHEVMNSLITSEIMMNPSTVFGSDDWSDFVHETKTIDLTSSVLNPFHEKNHYNSKSENSRNTTLTLPKASFFPGVMQIEELADLENKISVEIECTLPPFKYGLPKDYLNTSDLDNKRKEEPCELIDPIVCNDPSKNRFEYKSTRGIQKFVYLPKYIDGNTDIVKTKGVFVDNDVPSRKSINISCENKFVKDGTGKSSSQIVQTHVFEKRALESNSLPNANIEKSCVSTNSSENKEPDFPENLKSHLPPYVSYEEKQTIMEFSEGQLFPVKSAETEPNQLHHGIVDEMEEILLEPHYSPKARFHKSTMSQICGNETLRDSGSTASTSGSIHRNLLKIDHIEVVGAKQTSGNVSFGERFLGVKEYTVYKLRARSGHSIWEVERRYHDFCTLCHQIKAFYADMGWTIPSPWLLVEKESNRLFGNLSPSIVRERSDIIQSCLQSVIHSEALSGFPDIFFWFISLPKSLHCSHISSVSQVFGNNGKEHATNYGNTISLIVDNHPFKSMKQLLEIQHYLCAGCYKYFNCRKTGFGVFLQTLGWGKPRLCSYTGQLFCSSCHNNEMAVLPARVLHHWDFITYPVSQLAKSFLDSIHTQPMLCVSAVNPFLFTKVQSLLHVMSIRRQIASMLPHVHCPFLMSIHKGLQSRKYLLESNDFFSMRDLNDLSKGVFATLPPMMETVSKKIRVHITENCLVCCDVGVPCGRGVACHDMSSLIFPFQETEVTRCISCRLAFHNVCFERMTECPCGWRPPLHTEETAGGETTHDSNSRPGFLKGLLWKMKKQEKEEAHIMMGSFPTANST